MIFSVKVNRQQMDMPYLISMLTLCSVATVGYVHFAHINTIQHAVHLTTLSSNFNYSSFSRMLTFELFPWVENVSNSYPLQHPEKYLRT